MNSITVKAPAKVNLFLKILSKRRDSYHNIHTLFERISLYDTIKITKIPRGITVKADKPVTKNPKDNLVYKAANSMLARAGVRSGVRIEIKKRIPIAAGLGGGSSDAAATIIGINKLFNLKLKSVSLMKIGSKIGADVPFFLLDAPLAVGKGTGGNLSIMDSGKTLWHLLVFPGFKVDTKSVYKAFDSLKTGKSSLGSARDDTEPVEVSNPLTCGTRGVKIQALSSILGGAVRRSQRRKRFGEGGVSSLRDQIDIEALLYNDLERAAISKKQIIGGISKSLGQLLGRRFIVSGSGPSLFCLYGTGREAVAGKRAILRCVPAADRAGWRIFAVRTA
jgi:4-diphosphocytidyl-2C-methyl-D-erythritol kinase